MGMIITLRPWSPDDAERYLDLMNRVDFTYQDEKQRPDDIDNASWYLEWMIRRAQHYNSLYCAVLADGDVVGHVQMIRQKDCSKHDGHVGCLVAKDLSHQGIGTQAVRQVVTMAFRQGSFQRLTAWVYGPNKASACMLQKVGFKHEATLCRSVQKNGVFYDSLIYGLLCQDYANCGL